MEKEVLGKEKYYTPTIEEFHVGFEYEVYEFPYKKTLSKIKIIDEDSLITDFNGISLQGNIDGGFVRVKYLDKEDIESFGFIFEVVSSKYGNSDEYKIKLRGFEEVSLKLQRSDYSKVKIVSTDPGFSIDGPNYSTKFNGIIKNKSEFSRLLKQLSII